MREAAPKEVPVALALAVVASGAGMGAVVAVEHLAPLVERGWAAVLGVTRPVEKEPRVVAR